MEVLEEAQFALIIRNRYFKSNLKSVCNSFIVIMIMIIKMIIIKVINVNS